MIKLRTQVSLGQDPDPGLDLGLDAVPSVVLGSRSKTASRIGDVWSNINDGSASRAMHVEFLYQTWSSLAWAPKS